MSSIIQKSRVKFLSHIFFLCLLTVTLVQPSFAMEDNGDSMQSSRSWVLRILGFSGAVGLGIKAGWDYKKKCSLDVKRKFIDDVTKFLKSEITEEIGKQMGTEKNFFNYESMKEGKSEKWLEAYSNAIGEDETDRQKKLCFQAILAKQCRALLDRDNDQLFKGIINAEYCALCPNISPDLAEKIEVSIEEQIEVFTETIAFRMINCDNSGNIAPTYYHENLRIRFKSKTAHIVESAQQHATSAKLCAIGSVGALILTTGVWRDCFTPVSKNELKQPISKNMWPKSKK